MEKELVGSSFSIFSIFLYVITYDIDFIHIRMRWV